MATLFSRFGFSFKKDEKQTASPVAPRNLEASYDINQSIGAFLTNSTGISGQSASDNALIERYRDVSMMPEVDNAIEEIISEAIIIDAEDDPVIVNLDDLNVSTSTKKKINDSWNKILGLLDFNNTAYDIFKRFYIDGRIYYYLKADPNKANRGLIKVEYVDPRKIKLVREIAVESEGSIMNGQNSLYKVTDEYYVYSEAFVDSTQGSFFNQAPVVGGLSRIEKDAVAHANSGLTDKDGRTILSYLHKALRIATQVKWLEDSVLIYYLSRAPERRAFYISTMNIAKPKRESFMREVMARFSNKITYNPATGEISDSKKLMNLTDDYWIPRDDVTDATEIKNISGASNLADMTIPVDNFREKLLKSLNVPISRLDPSASIEFSMSATEVTRDELKFTRFIRRIRSRFSEMFYDMLRADLILTKVINVDDWEDIKNGIKFEFTNDNHFAELRDTELLMKRMRIADDAKTMLGMFFSLEQIQKNIMKMTDEEISEVEEYRKNNPQFEVDREGNMTQVPINTGTRSSVEIATAKAKSDKETQPSSQETSSSTVTKKTSQLVVEDDDRVVDIKAILEKHGIN